MMICGREMDGSSNNSQKSLERIVSQRAFQMSSSFPCQFCVVGFLCGVCLTSFFLAALTSFGAFAFGGISFSLPSTGTISNSNSGPSFINETGTVYNGLFKDRERIVYMEKSSVHGTDEKISSLYTAWTDLLGQSTETDDGSSPKTKTSKSTIPEAPHLENCKWRTELNQRLDTRLEDKRFPSWTIWKGALDGIPLSTSDEQLKNLKDDLISEGLYPPWVCVIV